MFLEMIIYLHIFYESTRNELYSAVDVPVAAPVVCPWPWRFGKKNHEIVDWDVNLNAQKLICRGSHTSRIATKNDSRDSCDTHAHMVLQICVCLCVWRVIKFTSRNGMQHLLD